jgi:tRNA A-37 threonylcarbamoyl transferase component Bud32
MVDRVGGAPPSDDNKGEWSAPITLAELERVPVTADDLLRRPDRHLPPDTAPVLASQTYISTEQDLQRFQIGDKLGAGGFADVWKAEDLTLGRTVALKFVRRSAPSAVAAAAHARVLAKVNHPNVVTVHDIVELRHPITADSADAIVMELLEGQTLEKRLRDKSFSGQELLKAGHGLLDAIGAYHVRDMAHMDLHEENVILASPELKVLDPLFYETSRFGRTDVLQSKQKRDVRDVRDILLRMLRHSEVSLESVAGFERTTGQSQPTLDVLRVELISAIQGMPVSDVAPRLTLSRSADTRLDVALAFEKAPGSDGKRHQYQLKALLKNTGDVIVPGVDFRIKFPTRFLLPDRAYQGERKHSATDTHRSFEDKEYGINIAPGDEYPRHLIDYQVTTDLFIRDKGEMDLPVTVDVYVNGRRVGSSTKPFRELQTF